VFEGLSALIYGGGSKAKTAEPKASEPKAEPIAEPAVVFLPAEPAVEQAPAPEPVDDDRRPVVETEELDEHLPARTSGRIAFLLQTFEARRIDRTQNASLTTQCAFGFRKATSPADLGSRIGE
jgi:hypothetical protein